MRLSATRLGAISTGRGFGDLLYDKAGQLPALDLNFAGTKTLDPRVTFTRASTGTFVGSDGVLRSAVTNLLLRSEEFETASWGKDFVAVTANVAVAPNGATTADKVAEDTSTNFHAVSEYVTGFASGAVLTLSIYAKAAGRTLFRIQTDASGGFGFADFNLSAVTATSGTGVFTAGSIQAVGDGWYRCSVRCTTSTAGAVGLKVILGTTTIGSYTGDGTSGLFLWGAQLEQSSTVGEYIPTAATINSAPRFDHNPTTGESLGLLVEEARTNLIIGSELFTGGGWTSPGSSSIASTTATTAPDSSNNAIKFIENTAASQFHYINYLITKAASAIQYTFSLYLKAAGREVAFSIANGSTGATARFNLATGTITGPAASYGVGFTAQGATITPTGNGWYRCTLTITTDSTTGLAVQFSLYNTALATNVYTGDGVSGTYAWGAQLEAGAFPTSYIPTTTATVTRAADVASITGSNFTSFYNQTEGTVFGQFLRTSSTNTQQGRVFSFNDGSNTNALEIYQTGGSNPSAQITATTGQALWTPSGFTVGTSIKEILGYKLNNSNASFNGSAETLDTVCNIPTVTQARIGDRQDGARTLNGTIQRLTYWPTRLADTTLQAISQL
jgi:hypothetical protein